MSCRVVWVIHRYHRYTIGLEICYTEPSISSNGEIGFHLVRQTNIGILNKHPVSLILVQSFHPGFVVHQKHNNELPFQISKQLCIVILCLKLQLKTKNAKVWMILSYQYWLHKKSIWLILCFRNQKCFLTCIENVFGIVSKGISFQNYNKE